MVDNEDNAGSDVESEGADGETKDTVEIDENISEVDMAETDCGNLVGMTFS